LWSLQTFHLLGSARRPLLTATLLLLAACSKPIVAARSEPPAEGATASIAPTPEPREIRPFNPAPDRVAAALWRRIGEGDARRELAAHYTKTGHAAMAELVSLTAAARSDRASVRPDSLSGPPPGLMWGCSAANEQEVDVEVRRVYSFFDDFDRARAFGLASLSRLGPACRLLVETAVATIGAVAAGGDISEEDFELALRTVVTADVEMGLPWSGGGREWPYQLLVGAFMRRGDPASAVIAAEVALARAQEEPPPGLPAAPGSVPQIERLLAHVRKVLARREG
jgi:hypothetical protein